MLLVLDVGNTNTVLGVFAAASAETPRHYDRAGGELARDHPGDTHRRRVWRAVSQFVFHGRAGSQGDPRNYYFLRGSAGGFNLCVRSASSYFNTKPLFVEPGVKTGVPVLMRILRKLAPTGL